MSTKRPGKVAHSGTSGRKQAAVRPIPGIEKTPGVCGGDPCIRQTRIPVWLLEQLRRLGASEADLLEDYPCLQAKDLTNAWAYVAAHADEIERQIVENEEREDQEDIEATREAAQEREREGTIPWEQVKSELGL
jgi:uncharacterized protein (DUF433 family)